MWTCTMSVPHGHHHFENSLPSMLLIQRHIPSLCTDKVQWGCMSLGSVEGQIGKISFKHYKSCRLSPFLSTWQESALAVGPDVCTGSCSQGGVCWCHPVGQSQSDCHTSPSLIYISSIDRPTFLARDGDGFVCWTSLSSCWSAAEKIQLLIIQSADSLWESCLKAAEWGLNSWVSHIGTTSGCSFCAADCAGSSCALSVLYGQGTCSWHGCWRHKHLHCPSRSCLAT